jgi:tetratricopeptide (TPR) repeat protein
MMNPDSFIARLMGRGIPSALAQRLKATFSDWEALCAAGSALLAEHFSTEEIEAIRRAKTRREIPSETVKRLIDECFLRCCLCWDIDHDTGVVIHHIRPHANDPDDSYENLAVLCTDHHSKVHTKWELARHPYPPELLLRRKADFVAAIAAFREGKRAAPGREKNTSTNPLVFPPLPPPHFIGRDSLVRSLVEHLRSPSGRAAIVGMGGVGKTALALKVADACRGDFIGGILWIEAATDFGGTPEILRTWIRSLGHDVAGMKIEEQLALFSDLLRKRAVTAGRLLLLIDDVGERMAKELVKLISYVPPDISVLITTREAMVGSAIGAAQFRTEPLERAESNALLESVSGSALVRTERSAVDTLLSMLGDLPLAVELVARQIAVRECKPEFSIGCLCRRLQDFAPELLSFPGHRGIAMSFALSYEHLDENEQRVFRSLGIFAFGAFDTTSMAAIGMVEKGEMESMLDRLVVVSMLDWGTRATEYRIHPLLHKYAEFLFNRSDAAEQGSTRTRFYQFYTSMAISTCKNSPDDLQAIDRIFPNLKRAIQYAAASGDHMAVSETVLCLCAGMEFFTMRNLERESMSLLELAIAAAKHLGDRDRESPSIGHLGTAYARLGMIRDAVKQYEQAVVIARETGNDGDLASHLHNLGHMLLSEAKDFPRAERLLHEALTAAQRSQNVNAVIACFSSLGNLHRQVGNLSDAARLYAGALEASRLSGSRLSEGNALSNLGLVTDQLGDKENGEKMIRDALAIAVEIGDKRGEGNRTGHLGGILLAKAERLPLGSEQSGALKSAREHITTAMRIAEETGDMEKSGSWLMNLGHLSLLEGNVVEGIKQIEAALRVAEIGGFALLEAQARLNLGSTLASQGKLQLALGHFRASYALLRRVRSPLAAKAEAYIIRLNKMLKR